MEAMLLLWHIETMEVLTAVRFPSYTACIEYMHETVNSSGVDALYFENKEAYLIGEHVLYCE